MTSGTGWPFPVEQFDVVTCFEVVEHLENPSKAISHIYQNLIEGGILLISTPNLKSYFYKKIVFNVRDRDISHISLKGPRQWKQLVQEQDFKILSSETVMYHWPSKRLVAKVWEIAAKILCLVGLGFKTEIVAIKR